MVTAMITKTTPITPPIAPPKGDVDRLTVAIIKSVDVSAIVDDNSVLVIEVVVSPGSTVDVVVDVVVVVVAVLSVGASVVTSTEVVGSVSVKGSSGVTVVSCSVPIYIIITHTVNL